MPFIWLWYVGQLPSSKSIYNRTEKVMQLQPEMSVYVILFAQLNPTCNPWAVDLSPVISRCVSQGERSPTSTCLQCNRSGTGLTLQLGSFRMWAVSFRKPGNSPVRSSWTFRRTRKFKTLQRSDDGLLMNTHPNNKWANIVMTSLNKYFGFP